MTFPVALNPEQAVGLAQLRETGQTHPALVGYFLERGLIRLYGNTGLYVLTNRGSAAIAAFNAKG